MASESLLLFALRLQAVLLAIAVLLLFGHGLWLKLRVRWSEPRLAAARAALARCIDTDPPADEDVALLVRLPVGTRVRAVAEVSRSIGGVQRERLDAVAVRTGVTRHAARLCRSRLWWRRLRGARLFTLARAGEAEMPRLLHDPHQAVRAQAAEWAATRSGPEVVDALLAMLSDPSRLCRFTVRDSLLRIGPPIVPSLRRHIEVTAGEPAVPALELAAALADARLADGAHARSYDAHAATRRQAAAVLAAIGGARAIDRLTELLRDGAAEVRAEAAGGLGRLGHWPAAPQLAPLLRDRAWVVRREAGLALRALGAPGALYLRRYVADGDRFAADMARQVLDLPGPAGATAQRT